MKVDRFNSLRIPIIRIRLSAVYNSMRLRMVPKKSKILTLLTTCVCLFGAWAGPVALAQDWGLYKDGVKVIDFRDMVDSSAKGMQAPLDHKMTKAQEFYRQVVGERTTNPFQAQEGYTKNVLQCRDLVAKIAGEDQQAAKTGATPEQLRALETGLIESNQQLLNRFQEIELTIRDQGYPPEKIERHLQVVKNHSLAADELISLVGKLREAYEAATSEQIGEVISQLRQYFDNHKFIQDPPLLNSQPSPMMMEIRKAPIIEEEEKLPVPKVPYPSADKQYRGPDPADLSPTIDVQFTDDITNLAASLEHSPVKIYNYVRDNCEFEAYLGSRKGSQQTIEHRRGNDYDQASLLIALLRVSGIPARYATGTIEMPIDRATNWLGIQDPENAGSILTTCGMEGVLMIMNGEPRAIRCRRVWVEAWLPFVNYRGAINDSVGFQWVPLDPTFKQYSYDMGINLPAEIGFDAESFVRDYYSTMHAETPVEEFKQMLTDSLAVHYPGATYEDLITSRTVIKETDGILPGTLPYELLSFDGAYSEIPTSKRYYIAFNISGNGTTLNYSTSLPEIVLKQVTISFIGATPADQQIIDDAGGIFNVTTPYLVHLKPVLKIYGCVAATGTGQVMMGLTINSRMDFTAPVGANNQMPTVSNTISAGNYQGIGIDTEDAFPAFFGEVETSCEEVQLGQEQHQLALTYLNKCDIADDAAADLLHIVVMNDVSEAIVENSVTVLFNGGGDPTTMTWAGMIVDADRKIIGPFSVDGIDNSCDFMRLGGADGSIQENRLFEDRFEEEAISAVKILELASDSGIAVCELIPGSPILSQCPGFSHTAPIWDAVTDALAIGHHVIIPEREFTYYEWTGTGYIDIDPNTCAAGYIISGGHGGGATVQVWVDPWYMWFWMMFCKISIAPITCSPNATNDLYCAESQDHWTFIVKKEEYLAHWPMCLYLGDADYKEYHVTRSIKSIADDPELGPGEYEFRTAYYPGNSCGCNTTPLTNKVTIVKIDFPEGNFLLSEGASRSMDVTVTPPGHSVPFTSSDPSIATVTGGVPTITINGISKGSATIRALFQGMICGTKDVNVFKFMIGFQLPGMSEPKVLDPLENKYIGVVKGDQLTFVTVTPEGTVLEDEQQQWTGPQNGMGPEMSFTFNTVGDQVISLDVDGVSKSATVTVVDVPPPEEWVWSGLHYDIIPGLLAIYAATEAWMILKEDEIGPNVDNTRANAAKHAYWNCLIALAYGVDIAEGLTTAHERSGLDGPHSSNVMDMLNNAKGRAIYNDQPWPPTPWGCSQDVIDALNEGRLTILDDPGNPKGSGLLIPSNQKGP